LIEVPTLMTLKPGERRASYIHEDRRGHTRNTADHREREEASAHTRTGDGEKHFVSVRPAAFKPAPNEASRSSLRLAPRDFGEGD
jgi:hypothetical protein